MSALLGLFFIAGLVWFVWAVALAARGHRRLNSHACPECGGFKMPRAPLCYTCTTR